MKRQFYYPTQIGNQVLWLDNYATSITTPALALGFTTTETGDTVADALWLAYVLGPWLTAARAFGEAVTEYTTFIQSGNSGDDPVPSPVFATPLPPAGTAEVPAGALTRIFDFVQSFKAAKGYTTTMGETVKVIGAEDDSEHPVPVYTLKVEQGGTCQCVRIGFRKYGHTGVYIEGRRNGGPWEFLTIDTESPYVDERPLANPTQPEVREYRLRWWDKGTPNGDWSDVGKVTVAP